MENCFVLNKLINAGLVATTAALSAIAASPTLKARPKPELEISASWNAAALAISCG